MPAEQVSQQKQPAVKQRSPFITLLIRIFMKAHIGMYRLTGGVLGKGFGKFVFLLLTTTGRKSGQERVAPILYIPDNERLVLIGSNWGAGYHPAWWLNLQANPQARVQVGGKTLQVTARQAEGEERQRLWERAIERYPNFTNYQEGMEREIPVVILTPE